MNRLIEKLKELSIQIPLEENFNWDFSQSPIKIPENINNIYLKNIYLKENLNKILEDDSDLKNHYWIIQEWGGIKSLKQNDRNDIKINKFKEQLNKGELSKEIFSLISSFSKLASFINSNKYAIYDSRAIYSLNWLLFNYTDNSLYPQPSSRNPKLSQYDLSTIFNLSQKNISYYSYKEAYFEYCKLLRYLSKEIYNEEKPYKIEMLLFLIAPKEIINSIKNSIKIIVNID